MIPANALPASRREQREQTRHRILGSAVDCFARSGFDAASLADIAQQAGVKKALVQYHFSTKEQLWRDAARHLWDERNDFLREALAELCNSEPTEKLRKGFTALVEFTRENPQWLWFMFHESSADGERLQWLIDHCLREDFPMGEQFVRQFQQQGLIRAGSPLHLLHLISGALTYNLLVAPLTLRVTGTDLSSEESIAQQVSLLQTLLAPQDD